MASEVRADSLAMVAYQAPVLGRADVEALAVLWGLLCQQAFTRKVETKKESTCGIKYKQSLRKLVQCGEWTSGPGRDDWIGYLLSSSHAR
jgi:hypothetical protein